jgi:hypothetical protein
VAWIRIRVLLVIGEGMQLPSVDVVWTLSHPVLLHCGL